MPRNSAVSLAVIIGAFLLIVTAVLVFLFHQIPGCPNPNGRVNASLPGAQVVKLQEENKDLRWQQHRGREQLEHLQQETHSLKVNLTSRLKEVFTLTEQVFNLTGENQRLQDDIVTWKRQSSSTSEQLLEAKALQEQLQQQNKEYQQKINELEFQMANQQPRTNGGSPRAADLCGWEVLIALFLLHLL